MSTVGAAGSGARPSSVGWMLEIFDVQRAHDAVFTGSSDGGVRRVVDGSQLLGQSIVAAAKSFPDRTVRSAHIVFVSPTDAERPLDFRVETVRAGRQFATVIVTAAQGGQTRSTATVLLDHVWPDVIRHPRAPAPAPGPDAAQQCAMPMVGRELRLVGIADVNDPAEVGPASIDAWLHYDPIPDRDDLRKALLAHFTGHLSISATMRGHAGIGTAQAHDTVSTAVMTISVAFHEPVVWDDWLLYRHDSTSVGGGMSYARGQVLTAAGDLLASFAQEGMIRGYAPRDPSVGIEVAARL